MRRGRNAVLLVVIAIALIGWAIAPKLAAAGTKPVPRGQADGWRTVTFGAVSLRVPSAWPVWNLAVHPDVCPLLDTHAVYLGAPGPDPACPAAAFGKTEAVQVEPIDPQRPDVMQAQIRTVIGGRAARTNQDVAVTHTIVDVLPSAGVEVSLSYGSDRALARQIESTITVRGAFPSIMPVGGGSAPPAGRPAERQLLYTGRGFDTCAAPSAATMRRWLASPYRAIGIYIGGLNETCAQYNLTAAWIRKIQAMHYDYFAMYAGLQAPCPDGGPYGATISLKYPGAQGAASAEDAVAQARRLGIPRGTPIFYDMEPYRSGCANEVNSFISRWDQKLHAEGYLAGAYWNANNARYLARDVKKMIEPDDMCFAHWNGQATTSDNLLPAHMWTNHHRIHQYLGRIIRTYGGITLNIDLNKFDLKLPHA